MSTFSQSLEVGAETPSTQKEIDIAIESPFNDIIGQCFYPYLYIYINSVDRYFSFLEEKKKIKIISRF